VNDHNGTTISRTAKRASRQAPARATCPGPPPQSHKSEPHLAILDREPGSAAERAHAAGANEIEGVDFDVIAKRELRAEARRKAVAAAAAKADLYAEAAGVRVGAVLHVEDVDPEQPGAARYRSHAEAAASTAQDLAPGHIVVSAAVILGYAVAH
jgi:uncharacterized protein YggE